MHHRLDRGAPLGVLVRPLVLFGQCSLPVVILWYWGSRGHVTSCDLLPGVTQARDRGKNRRSHSRKMPCWGYRQHNVLCIGREGGKERWWEGKGGREGGKKGG